MYIYAVIIIHNGRFRFLPSISSLINALLMILNFVNRTASCGIMSRAPIFEHSPATIWGPVICM